MTRTVTAHTIASALRRVKALPQLVQHQHVLDGEEKGTGYFIDSIPFPC